MNGLPNLNDDLNELIGLFLSHGVEFLVVGAHALAFHGRPRFTEDLDLFIDRSRENATKVRDALQSFGFAVTQEAVDRLALEDRGMIVLGRKPNQLDLLNFLDGTDYALARQRSSVGQLGAHEVRFIGIEDYAASKRASGRPKDLLDLQLLGQINNAFSDEN